MGRLITLEGMLGRRATQRATPLRRHWLPALARDPALPVALGQAMDGTGGRVAPSLLLYPPLSLRWLFRRPATAAAGEAEESGHTWRRPARRWDEATVQPYLQNAPPPATPAPRRFARSNLFALPIEAEPIDRLLGARELGTAPAPRGTAPAQALPASVARTISLAQRQAASHPPSRLLAAAHALPLVCTDGIPTEERFLAPRGGNEDGWPAQEGSPASTPTTTSGWDGLADDSGGAQSRDRGHREPMVARLAGSPASGAAPAGEEEIPPELAHLPPLLAKLIVRDQVERRNKARELPHAAPHALTEPGRITGPSAAVPDATDMESPTGFAAPSEPAAPRWPRPFPPNAEGEGTAARWLVASRGDLPAAPAQRAKPRPEKADGGASNAPERAGDVARAPNRQAEPSPPVPGATAAAPRAIASRRRGVVTEVARSEQPGETRSGQPAGEGGAAGRGEPMAAQSSSARPGSMDAPADALTMSNPARVPPMARRLPPVPPSEPSLRPSLAHLIDATVGDLPPEARPVIAEAITLGPAALPAWEPGWARPAPVDDEGLEQNPASGKPVGHAGPAGLPLPPVAVRRSDGSSGHEAPSGVASDPAWPGVDAAVPAVGKREEQYLGLLFGSIAHSSATPPDLALAPISRPTTTETVQTAPADATADTAGAQEDEGAQPSLDHLAQQVYDILKHRLAVERERLGGIG